MSTGIHLFGAITKMDCADGSITVSGIASTECTDADGEVVTAEAMRKALPAYLLCGTVREMHQPIAAGKPISAFVDESGNTHFTAKIVDKGTIDKIKQGVLKGFSIGGKALKKVGNEITELLLKDISVVDLPNNPEARFEIIKFDSSMNVQKTDPGKAGTYPLNHEQQKTGRDIPDTTKADDSLLNHDTPPDATDNEQKCDGCGKPKDKCACAKTAMTKGMTIESLAALVTSLTDTVSKLSASQTTIQKMESEVSELRKANMDNANRMAAAERGSILEKMRTEGRVAFNPETGLAYKSEELQKMDLNMLKFAAKNSPVLPLQAQAVYKGDSAPKIDPKVKGSDRINAVWADKYGSLDVMKANLS